MPRRNPKKSAPPTGDVGKVDSPDAQSWLGGVLKNVAAESIRRSPQLLRSAKTVDSDSDEYAMTKPKRGKAVIINNAKFRPSTKKGDRMGSSVDTEHLKGTFEDLGFDVEIHNDLSTSEMLKVAMDNGTTCDHSEADCFVFVIMSHGDEEVVYGNDGVITVDSLIQPFKSEQSKSLKGKPKLFFIQACRGKELADSIIQSASDAGKSNRPGYHIPSESDILIAHSTIPGHYAWRNHIDGCWFIQALCTTLKQYAQSKDLLWILTKVNRCVAFEFDSRAEDDTFKHKKQMPCVLSMLTKQLYIKPK